MPMLNTCGTCGIGETADSTSNALADLIRMYGAAGASVIQQNALRGGVYTQSANGDITYVQPDGSTAIIPFTAGATVSKTNLQAAAGAPFSDTSTVLIIGLGLAGVFMLFSALRKK